MREARKLETEAEPPVIPVNAITSHKKGEEPRANGHMARDHGRTGQDRTERDRNGLRERTGTEMTETAMTEARGNGVVTTGVRANEAAMTETEVTGQDMTGTVLTVQGLTDRDMTRTVRPPEDEMAATTALPRIRTRTIRITAEEASRCVRRRVASPRQRSRTRRRLRCVSKRNKRP
jgi:hypothetical protein